jgi:hypothetical protein
MKTLRDEPGSACITDWYQRIEPGIRPHVRFLRDHGFNTYSSCQERMEVAIELLSRSDDMGRLDQVLAESDFGDYTILVRLARSRGVPGFRFGAVVQFGDQRTRQRIARLFCSLVSWWWEAVPARGRRKPPSAPGAEATTSASLPPPPPC